MTAAGVHPSPPEVATATSGWPALPRLLWLYLVSRRGPAAAAVLAGLAAMLGAGLRWHWDVAGGPAARQLLPLSVEAAAAAVVAVSCYGPFGESERATGRWLPWLRLGTLVALLGLAAAALAAGATAGGLPGGDLGMLRNLAGLAGVGLVTSVVLGGAFGWVGPMGYLLLTETALASGWTTPWFWPARPAGDTGGAVCASLVCAVGLAVVTLRGTRETARD